MQLVKRLGKEALPVVEQKCTTVAGGFNCSANLTVTTSMDGSGMHPLLPIPILLPIPTSALSMNIARRPRDDAICCWIDAFIL
jgi:hypothetical protein